MFGLFARVASMAAEAGGWGKLLVGTAGNVEALKHVGKLAAFNLGIPLAFTVFGHDTPQNKAKKFAADVGIFALTLGIKSPARQFFYMQALSMTPALPMLAKATVQTFRTALDARTTAAIPFSHSTINMDQAYGALQYASSRMREAYNLSGIGNEAALYHAKYTSRG